ncbi:hypothetical protein VP01_2361g1, partial [Puccinia sorghi]
SIPPHAHSCHLVFLKVCAERQPLMNTRAGNILGTQLKEKILAAIKRQKAPVENCIKDLTFADFLKMDLEDPLWNNSHFYHARVPWELDPNEEVELITQELDRAISWACEYHNLLVSTIGELEVAGREPLESSDRFSKKNIVGLRAMLQG